MIRNIIRNATAGNCRASIAAKVDQRVFNKRKPLIDREVIKQHIESFKPQISHYRREHAPLKRYLPSDITIQFMYNHFLKKYPNIKFSYYLYREEVAKQNISFTKLGNEECWSCEIFSQHEKTTSHRKTDPDSNCDDCNLWTQHRKKYRRAREEYQNDGHTNSQEKTLTVTADLQKVNESNQTD